MLFALAWVLAAAVESGVHPAATFRVGLVAVAVALGFQALGWLLTRSRTLSGLIAVGAMVLLLAADIWRLLLAVILLAAGSAAVIVARRIWGLAKLQAQATPTLNLVTALLLVVLVGQGFTNGWLALAASDVLDPVVRRGVERAAATEGTRTDVYIVLLDGYPRADVLGEVFDFDNSPFLSELERRGFAVARNSRANYMYTTLTLAAAFNGELVTDIDRAQPLLAGQHRPGLDRRVVSDGRLLNLLRESGYTIIANASTWEHAALRNADVYLDASAPNEFERRAMEDTLVGAVAKWLRPSYYQDIHARWIGDALEHLSAAANAAVDGPRFAFVHVPSPHLPLVFDSIGGRPDPVFGNEFRSGIPVAPEVYRDAFVEQLEYLNGLILEAVDRAQIPNDAVVVLMSDHGSDTATDYLSGERSDLRERFATLFASRLPDDLGPVYPADVSASNVLTLLLPEIIGVELEHVADRFFVSDATARFDSLDEVPDPWAD